MIFGESKHRMLHFEPVPSVTVLEFLHFSINKTDLTDVEFYTFVDRVFPNATALVIFRG